MFVKLVDQVMHEVYAYDDDRGVGITYCGQFVGPYDMELAPPSNCPLCLTNSYQGKILDQEAVFGLVKKAAEEKERLLQPMNLKQIKEIIKQAERDNWSMEMTASQLGHAVSCTYMLCMKMNGGAEMVCECGAGIADETPAAAPVKMSQEACDLLFPVVSEISRKLTAKVRTILMREENRSEIMTFLQAEVDRELAKIDVKKHPWRTDLKLTMDENREPTGEPFKIAALPKIQLRGMLPNGHTINGHIQLTTTD